MGIGKYCSLKLKSLVKVCGIVPVCKKNCKVQNSVTFVGMRAPGATCDETTSATHFPVPFGTIFQFFFDKIFYLFSAPCNFLTVRDPPYGENWKVFPNDVYNSSN